MREGRGREGGRDGEKDEWSEGGREGRSEEGRKWEREEVEREGEKTAVIPSVLNQLQISREPPHQRALCHGTCRSRSRRRRHGGWGSR